MALVDILPDLNALQAEEQALLKLDIDAALEQFPPLLREVLVARYISGESCGGNWPALRTHRADRQRLGARGAPTNEGCSWRTRIASRTESKQ